MSTMDPAPLGIMTRAECLTERKEPIRLRSTVARTPSTSASTMAPMWCEPPAQAKVTSSVPVTASAVSTAAAICSSMVTSATMWRTEAPGTAASIWATAPSSFSAVRPQMVTAAPSSANRVAVARPMPEPPPVMRALLPVKLMVMGLS